MQKKAPVYNYYYSSQGHQWSLRSRKWGKGCTCREGWTGQVTNEVFHAMHVITLFKAGESRGFHFSSSMASFSREPCSLSCLPSWSRFQSVHSWVPFLPTAKAILGLPGAAWQLLVGHHHPVPNSGKLSVISLIINMISIISVMSKTFPPFPFLWWEGGG